MTTSDRLRLFIIVFFLWCIPCVVSSQKQRRLDSLINVWNREWKLSKQDTPVSISIGVYDRGASRYYVIGSKPLATAAYEIGSITKTFTGLLLAHAVADAKLSLQDDVRKYLDGPYLNLEYDGEPVRILHLANSTSGLPNDWGGKYWKEALGEVKLRAVPGTTSSHSNAASQLLGQILERVYQRPLGQEIAELITQPLGMRSTFLVTSHPPKSKRLNGYNAYGQPMPPFTDTAMLASAGLVSTAADLLRYAVEMMESTSEIVRMSLQPSVTIDARTNQVTTLSTDTVTNPNVYHYCLGWLRYYGAPDRLQIWSDGGTDGFCSYLVFYPQRKLAIVLLANQASDSVFRQLPAMAAEIAQ